MTVTQKGDMKTRLMTPFLSFAFGGLAVQEGTSFKVVSCEIRIFVSFDSEKIHIKERKKPGFIFSIELTTKSV